MALSRVASLTKSLLARTESLGSPHALNVVAFSGGIDSTLASYLVREVFPTASRAVIGVSHALPQEQLQIARDVAASQVLCAVCFLYELANSLIHTVVFHRRIVLVPFPRRSS